jgi:hypothetical protein
VLEQRAYEPQRGRRVPLIGLTATTSTQLANQILSGNTPSECPAARSRFVDFETGEIRFDPCGRLSCRYCRVALLPQRRAAAIGAIGLGQIMTSTGFDTLSRVPLCQCLTVMSFADASWPDAQVWAAASRVMERVHRKIQHLLVCYVVERMPLNQIPHLHVLATPWRPADAKSLREALVPAVLTYSRPLREPLSWGTYMVKSMRGNPEGHLALNGGRITHQSNRLFPQPLQKFERAALAHQVRMAIGGQRRRDPC